MKPKHGSIRRLFAQEQIWDSNTASAGHGVWVAGRMFWDRCNRRSRKQALFVPEKKYRLYIVPIHSQILYDLFLYQKA